MAKRIQFSQHGGPEVLQFVEFEPTPPGPQQVRVRNHAIGLNFIDTYFEAGCMRRRPCLLAWVPKRQVW